VQQNSPLLLVEKETPLVVAFIGHEKLHSNI